jgi:hypothetical protein
MGLAGGCAPAAPPAETPKSTAASGSDCPDDGPRLPVTGICRGRTSAYFTANASPTLGAGEGCRWVGSEITTPDPDEVFLVMAAQCGEKTAAFELSAGARSASIMLTKSAMFDETPEGVEVARVFVVPEGTDGRKMILDMAKQSTTDKKQAAACELRAVNPAAPSEATYPKDALVVDASAAYKTATGLGRGGEGPAEGAYTACGDWGYTSDGVAYWLIRGGYAFFVNLGQDLPDLDPGTLTVFRKGADGAWGGVE